MTLGNLNLHTISPSLLSLTTSGPKCVYSSLQIQMLPSRHPQLKNKLIRVEVRSLHLQALADLN